MKNALLERLEIESKVLRDASWSGIATTMLDAMVTLRKAREALFRAAPSHQGGHSTTGAAIAEALGVGFPLNVYDLERAAKEEGYDPNVLWPWLQEQRKRAQS
jgi:hypothetical protein